MSYRQLISPNLNPTIVESGRVLPDWYGWCLGYVQNAFGTGWAGKFATQCWDSHAVNKHDGTPPSGVYVPIYFSGYGGLGHLAIYKDGKVYSSPWHHKVTYDEMNSIEETAHIYNVTYVGWCEGLAGKQLVEYIQDAVVTPSVPKFTVVETYNPAIQVQLNKQPTNLWGMNYDFDYMSTHPVEVHNKGEIWGITNKVHHVDGYDYYRREGQVDGFNVLDCDLYTSPTPPVPYIPPAAPLKGTPAEMYTLVTPLPFYNSLDAVTGKRQPSGTLQSGQYYVWSKGGSNNIFYNLSTTNSKDSQQWVNTLDNKVVVAKTAEIVSALVTQSAPSMTTAEIRASYRSIPDGPMTVSVKTNIMVADIVGSGSPKTITIEDKPFHIFGTFRKNEQWYAMPKLDASDPEASNYMYGIPIASSTSLEPFLEATYGYPERISYGVQAWYDRTIATIEGIFRPRKTKR
jgi:hypothetical protein